MQTAAISYRVADFLKQHPPFQTMEEADLLALVEHGRVRFHEADEYVYWQGKPHAPFVYVIQQGTVSLWEEVEGGERLRDIRGAGDMLGIDRFLGSETSVYSAKTCSDMVIYALRVTDFEPLLAKYTHACRYVTSHAGASTEYQQPDRRRAAHEMFLSDVVELRPPLTCGVGESIRDAARRMTAAGAHAIAVEDGDHRLAGLITSEGILQSIAAGAPCDTRAEIGEPCVVAPDATVSQCVLAMADAGVDAVAVAGSPGQSSGLVTAADLAPVFQDQPLAILRAIPYAPDTAGLRRLHQRARAFLLEQLVTPASVDWLARLAYHFDAAILKRVLELLGLIDTDSCWCFFGASGRGESLAPAAPQIAVIHRQAHRTECRFDRAIELLRECGYAGQGEFLCGSLEEWRARFRSWLTDPLESRMYCARPLFDLRPLLGPAALWRELAAEVTALVETETVFIRLLANDCLASLPPLTFFRDLVIDDSGERTDVFHLERSALLPLVDVGRVFGIAARRPLTGSTMERFAMARALMPDREAIFREAVEALRVVLYHQARTGIRQGSGGSELPPALLSRYDRQILKGCFRSIHRLLEFTAECQWLEQA
jgi:CBS domain-containing protein